MTRWSCALYGLHVDANLPLPGVSHHSASCAAVGPPDVRVNLTASTYAGLVSPASGTPWYETPERDERGIPLLTVWQGSAFIFDYAEGARFTVSADGGAIDGSWQSPLNGDDAVSFVIGPIMAFVLRLRGIVPLHASAVVVGDHAVLFCGPEGVGKSTTAAALGVQGHGVLSDDLVPIDVIGGDVWARPGVPRVSVWDDSAHAVFGAAGGRWPVCSPSYPKRRIDVNAPGLAPFSQPVRVSRIYVLDDPGPPGMRVALFTVRDALLALTANTYADYLSVGNLRAAEFGVLGDVVTRVPVHALQFGGGLDALARDSRLLIQLAEATEARGAVATR